MAAKKKKKAAAKKKPAPKKKAAPKKKKAASKKMAAPKAKATPRANDAARATRLLAETVLRALTITVVADGEIAAEEEELLRRISHEPIFQGIDARVVIGDALKGCLERGVDASLADIAKNLPSVAAREAAFTTCVAAAASDGRVTASEARLLRKIRDAFGIPNARAISLAGPAGPVFA
jgi:tellurite resistance protein